MAQVLRNVLLQRVGLNTSNQVFFNQLVDAGNVDGHNDIRRAVAAFTLKALGKALLGKHNVRFNAGFFGEGVEQGFQQVSLAVGIDVDLAVGGGGQRHGGQSDGGSCGKFHTHSVDPFCRVAKK